VGAAESSKVRTPERVLMEGRAASYNFGPLRPSGPPRPPRDAGPESTRSPSYPAWFPRRFCGTPAAEVLPALPGRRAMATAGLERSGGVPAFARPRFLILRGALAVPRIVSSAWWTAARQPETPSNNMRRQTCAGAAAYAR
jgi:hypothetical protein